jgi:protein SCO1/2
VKHFVFHLLAALTLLTPGGPAQPAETGSVFDGIKVEFELLDHNGSVVTEVELRGKYILLAFGFTHCRHICPVMAANIGMTLQIAGVKAMGVFISVDTERDTPEITHTYASKFSGAMIGLSGSHEQVSEAASNFGISFVVSKSQKAYTVEHTSDIFLISPAGKVLDVFALNAPPADIAAAMNVPDSR